MHKFVSSLFGFSAVVIFILQLVIAKEETGHSWSDLVNSFVHKDFYYYLGDYLYGSPISYNHPDQIYLRVGKKWEKTIGSSSHEVVCERASEKDYYKLDTNFLPNLYIYSDKNGVANKNILSYFTSIEREIWVCRSRLKMKSSQPISFYRIVNVMHGIQPMNKIFYFDGIEVFKDRCAMRQVDDMGEADTATFREIKYVDPSDKKVVRYRGKVFLKTDPTTTTKPRCELELVNRNGATSYSSNLPLCALKRRNKITESYSAFADDGLKHVNSVYFSIIRQELWKCFYVDGRHFWRRMTVLVGSIPVQEIEYYSGISVWRYRLDSSTYSVKIREIFYYKPNNERIGLPVKFGGVVKLMKPPKERHYETKLKKHTYKYNKMSNQMPTRLYPDYDDDTDDEDLLDMGAAVI
ncbi:uncharacterized protein LOC120353680 isoform X4 [Nilaparvata lugens]|uniref:uncharacterized protein LOC120353680 isoform X3 n=1 Tax=Nilaparvata lugens TaxID=108931 RepID=UPI00193DFA8C|nr:uncharacterized protein LOC120353680 isoform X3 [Nilaparvata lugens]XP_039294300.1 uncharacterized protein LOC120353680 isoform X4 [Nilaparvata lugens]